MSEIEPPSNAEIDEFVKNNDVDDRAAADLKDCPPDVQRRVLDRGDLSTARNSSAALVMRIRDARIDARLAASGSRAALGLPSTKEVDDFIEANDIDAQAAEALRSCSPTAKRVVLETGGCKHADNPSALLLSRIRDAGVGRGGGGVGGESSVELEDFIKHNGIDERAAADLRDCVPAIQRAVIARGDLKTARNPSSAVLSRIRDARLGVGGVGPQPSSLATFPGGQAATGAFGHPSMGYPMTPPGFPPGYPGGYFGYPGYYGFPPGGYGGYPAEVAPPAEQDTGKNDTSKKAKKRHRSRSESYSYSGSSYSYSSSTSRSSSRSRSRSRGRKSKQKKREKDVKKKKRGKSPRKKRAKSPKGKKGSKKRK